MMEQTRILFVDDDILNHWAMAADLTEAGYTVCGQCRGSEAVRVLKQGRAFDLLVTDMQLPDGMSGAELAAIWRRLQPGRPVLFTSAFPQSGVGAIGKDAAFILKYAPAGDLIEMVATVLSSTCRLPASETAPPRMLVIH